MGRQARRYGQTGIYHLMVRGINRTEIFGDDKDRLQYINTLASIKNEESVSLLGYCLMPNHVHLLGKDNNNTISKFMHRLNIRYSRHFNARYERVGHLFQNRFKSEAIDDDAYLMTVLRYIHLNPVKAGISAQPDYYRWSSCRVYYGSKDVMPGLTDTEFILSLYSDHLETAREAIRQATMMDSCETCQEYEEKLTDTQAFAAIKKVLHNRDVHTLTSLPRGERNAALQQIKSIRGLSIRQIARLTGVTFNIVKRA